MLELSIDLIMGFNRVLPTVAYTGSRQSRNNNVQDFQFFHLSNKSIRLIICYNVTEIYRMRENYN